MTDDNAADGNLDKQNVHIISEQCLIIKKVHPAYSLIPGGLVTTVNTMVSIAQSMMPSPLPGRFFCCRRGTGVVE